MATTSKYFVTLSPGSNLLDFDLAYGTLSLQGQEIVFTGTNGIDNVTVAPGVVFDFTKSNGGIDNIYLPGNLADYTTASTTSTLTLMRGTGASAETVLLAKGTSDNYDTVAFADGSSSTFALHGWAAGGTIPTLGSAPALPTTLNATVKGFALDATGETFTGTSPGINFIATGGNGVDIVYVKAGATVDASKLNSGEDKIYLTGNWADYTKVATSSKITFTNATNGETVIVAAATGASNDRLIFADGYVLSNDAKTALLANAAVAISAVNGYSNTETTPLPGPSVTIAANDSALKVGETATLTFTLSEAPGNATAFTVGDIVANGGVLSNFSGSGTSYTATFTPTSSFEGAASISVAAGVFTNGSGQNNTAAQQLSMVVDTIAPVAATIGTVATNDIVDATERAAGVTATGTNEAGATVTLNGAAVTQVTGTAWSYSLTATEIDAFGQGAETLTVVSTDAAGNAATATRGITVDTVAPTTTLTSAVYNDITGVLAVTGTNLDTLGVANGTDVKSYLDWTKIVWDINGDDATTANKTFTVDDITSAVVTDATALTITLVSAAKTALEGTTGFGATGGSDKLDVTAGFIKDTVGNVATTDGLANGTLVTDSTAPTATLTSAAYNTTTGVLTVTGTNLDTIGAATNTTDIKSYLDWAKIVWDTNGDDGTTANKTFAASDITSAMVTNATTLTITLNSTAKTALEGTTGFCATGGADKLDVTAGFIKDTAGNVATTDALANGAITYSDVTAPAVSSFSSTATNGTYKAADTINITATMSETVLAGATFDVTLSTNDVVTLTAASTGLTLTGTYTVGAGDSSADLTVNSYTAGTVSDIYGNAMVSTTLPTTQNLANNAALVIDTTAPTTTLTSAAYNTTTGVLTVTGTNLDTIGAATSTTDIKSYLDWAKIVWDINGDDATTANKTFAAGDITSAMVTNANTLTITLTSTAKTALEGTTGFCATGGADKLDVTAGFIKDTAGNAATTDALANGAITYSDVTAPTVFSFSSSTTDGAYNAADTVNITATMSETVLAGATFDVTLSTNDVITLTAASTGLTLTGTYTVGAGDSSADLTVNSYTAGTVSDIYGNAMVSTTLPTTQNLANNAALVIDTTAPTTTLTSAAYNTTTGVLTVTGANLGTIGAATSTTDIKSYLDWAKIVWDINGDGTTTTDKTFASTDITSAVVTNATTLTVTLTSTAKTALEGTTGFGAVGTADKLDVTAGFVKDVAGNAATTDALANGAITYSDVTAPTVTSFGATTTNGIYNAGSTIVITATMSETVQQGATFNVTLDTNDVISLTAASAGTTLTGAYTVGAGDTSADLTVNSFAAGTVTDMYGNAMVSTTLPSGQNLANNAALVIDSAPPTATLTSAAYNNGTGVLTVTGANLDTIGAASNTTDIKSYLDWTKIVWDINGDDGTTANKTFAVGDITSAVVTNATALTITLTSTAKAALEGTTGFAAGTADKLDVTAGFIKDTAGNAATTDALANGAITYSDVTAPMVASFGATANGTYNAGSTIDITATMSEAVQANSTFVVTLDTNDTVTLTAASAGTTLTGTYTVGAGDTSADLTVNSFAAGTVTDMYGNAMVSTTLPSGQNLANNAALVIDTTAPTTTLTSAAYNGSTGVLTVTGTNLDTLGVANGTDVKAQLGWANIVWDINGDGVTTADKTFAVGDITSAVVTNATTLTVTLTSTAKAALEGTSGFGAAGTADKLDVTAGFIKDTAGNAATTDALANGALTYSGVMALSYSITSFNEAANNDGSITATSVITLTGDTFTGTNSAALTGAVVSSVPTGLTAAVIKTGDNTATLSFTGSATAHANVNDIVNLTVTMGNTTFTGGNASLVTGATKSNLAVNFADIGAIFSGDAGPNTLVGNAGDNIIYGGGGVDAINGSAGNDTIDITDTGVTAANSASIVITSTANGTDTIIGFGASAVASGGDILDFSAIVNLTDAVATGQTLTTDFAANNVFVFDGTPVTIAAAATAIAADPTVVATVGYIVIADSANSNAVTVYHSTDLAANGTETALAILSGVTIANLTAANFIV